jgi:A/G-specific adenine glycosylase
MLPVKALKTKVTDRFFYYLVIRKKGSFYMKQRTGGGIWRNLHDFPLIESAAELAEEQLLSSAEWKSIFENSSFHVKRISAEWKHVLSHQRLHVRFLEIETDDALAVPPDWMLLNEKLLQKFAVPVLIQNYLDTVKKAEFA